MIINQTAFIQRIFSMAFSSKVYQLLLAFLFTSSISLKTVANTYNCSQLLVSQPFGSQETLLKDTFTFIPANSLRILFKELPDSWSEIARPVYEMDKQLWSLTKNGIEMGSLELFNSEGQRLNVPIIFKGDVGSIPFDVYGKHIDDLLEVVRHLPENQKYLIRFTHTHPGSIRTFTFSQFLSHGDVEAADSTIRYINSMFPQKHIVLEFTSVTFMEPTIGDLIEAKLSFFKTIKAINKKVWKKSTIVSVKNLQE